MAAVAPMCRALEITLWLHALITQFDRKNGQGMHFKTILPLICFPVKVCMVPTCWLLKLVDRRAFVALHEDTCGFHPQLAAICKTALSLRDRGDVGKFANLPYALPQDTAKMGTALSHEIQMDAASNERASGCSIGYCVEEGRSRTNRLPVPGSLSTETRPP